MMINLREVEEAIKQLESSSATYNNCTKLASLYIVRDELMKKESGYTSYSYGYNNKPMMYHNNDDDLIIRHDMMGR